MHQAREARAGPALPPSEPELRGSPRASHLLQRRANAGDAPGQARGGSAFLRLGFWKRVCKPIKQKARAQEIGLGCQNTTSLLLFRAVPRFPRALRLSPCFAK